MFANKLKNFFRILIAIIQTCRYFIITYLKIQTIYLMLYKRRCKKAKIQSISTK